MRIYLDNSFLNRPFDDPAVAWNRLEGEILFSLIELVHEKELELVHSSVIAYENSLNPFPERRAFIEEILKYAVFYQDIDERIYQRASLLVRRAKIKPIDALHLATAETAGVDVFITCDYTLIKRYRGTMSIMDPLSFVINYERRDN